MKVAVIVDIPENKLNNEISILHPFETKVSLDYGDSVVYLKGDVYSVYGYVTESNATHKRITYMRPTKRDYSDKDHPNYYKYTCPVCDMLGNKHQVHKGETNCCLCGVNLLWEEEINP